jgi:peptidoglycan/xylan/chitin deacetylase (PgdA/CDA1 family)
MGRWTTGATQVGILVLLFLMAAALPGTGIDHQARPASMSMVARAAADPSDDPDGFTVEHSARPTPSPSPTPTPTPAPLLLGEVTPKKAPVPAGPATYVPILTYHYIRINPNPRDRVGFGLSTPPAAFAAQMQYLADHGFRVISLHQAVVAIQSHGALPSRPVVLTFDDGYADFFSNAVPILQSHGFTATSFVITGRMGSGGFMTPGQIVALDGLGMTIGAHTVDHVALAAQPPARASWEIQQSKSTLEALLGHPVLDFAYPYGSFNFYDMAQAKGLGFETAVSTLSGTWHSPGQLFELSRVRIGGGIPLAYFANLMGGPPPTSAELAGTAVAPTSPPAPSAAPTPSPAPSPTPAPTPSPTLTPVPSPTLTPVPSPSAAAPAPARSLALRP